MPVFSKVKHKGKWAKREIFHKDHKLAISLPVHKQALELGLRVPKLYDVIEKKGRIYKYTEWVAGDTIYDVMNGNPKLIEPVCMDWARYICELYDGGGIIPLDSHLKNFVWHKNREVIYIDLKKLAYGDDERHVLSTAKLCLKGCRADRRKILAFLKSYAKYKDVGPIMKVCDRKAWHWWQTDDLSKIMDPIKIEELR